MGEIAESRMGPGGSGTTESETFGSGEWAEVEAPDRPVDECDRFEKVPTGTVGKPGTGSGSQ